MKVRWRLDCSDRVGIVTGYKISYCAIDNPKPDAKCKKNALKEAIADPDKSEFIISDLDPFIYYKVGVSVLTRGGEGEVSDYVVNRTSPARPGSAPRNFQITVNPPRNVSLSWDPPAKPNGLISFYQIEVSYISFDGRAIKTSFQSKALSSKVLDSNFLVSNAKYHIALRACTILPQFDVPSCGLDWNNQTFVTPFGASGRMKDPIVYFENSTLLQVSWNPDHFHKGGDISHYEVRLTKGDHLSAPIFSSSHEESEMAVSLMDLEDSDDWIISDCGYSSSSSSSSAKVEPYNVTVRAVTYDFESKEEFLGPWSNPTSTLGYCSRYIPIWLYMCVTIACVLVGIFGLLYGVRFYILSKDKRIQFDEVDRKLSAGFISKNMVDKFHHHHSDDSTYGKKVNQKFDRSNSLTTLLHKDSKVIVNSGDSCSSITSGRSSSRMDEDSLKTLQSDYEMEKSDASSLNRDKGTSRATSSSGYVSMSSPACIKTLGVDASKDLTNNPVISSGYVPFDEVMRDIEPVPSSLPPTGGYVSLCDVKLSQGDFNNALLGGGGGGNSYTLPENHPMLKNNSYTRVSMIIPHEIALKKNNQFQNIGYQNLNATPCKNMQVELKNNSVGPSAVSGFHSVKSKIV